MQNYLYYVDSESEKLGANHYYSGFNEPSGPFPSIHDKSYN